MLSFRGIHTLRRTFGATIPALRSSSTVANDATDNMPVKMENPYKLPEKGCILCNTTVDFKNTQLLSQFVSPHTGRIYGRTITGFMPVTHKHPQFMKDPNICNRKN
ncbi:hypothetical protein CRUP_017681 [Coryphaenoides rupestris]|nr:hypothetical protein CRUP_017681 [Coryphaenoides rupestris]